MTPAEAEQILIANGFDPLYLRETRFFFLESFKKGDLALAEAFIVCGVPLRAEGDREPAIIKAAEGNQFAAIELAMRYGARLDARDRAGDTALHTAANWNHADLVRKLAEAGAALDNVNNGRWTPLSKAVADAREPMVKLLLDLGASPDAGPVPALWAAKTPAMHELLLARGANPNVTTAPPSNEAILTDRIARGMKAEAELLLKHGARGDANAAGWTAWMTAMSMKATALAERCVANGATTNDAWRLPFHAAKTVAEVDAALAAGAPLDAVDRLGQTALVVTSKAKLRDVALRLVAAGADVTRADLSGRSAVTYAAAVNDLELLEKLLAAGASPNESIGLDGKPRSFALGHAGANGHVAAVERLIAAGANLESVDEHQQTAVLLAAVRGRLDVLDVLLKAGADPNHGGKTGSWPLSMAAGKGNIDCVKRLAEGGADLEREGLIGKTVLASVADVYNNANPTLGAIATVLLAAGADPRHSNDYGAVPLEMADMSKNVPVQQAMHAFLATGFLARHRLPDDAGVDWKAAVAAMHEENLRALVRSGDLDSIRALFEAGLDVALFAKGTSPVIFATVPHLEIFDLALDRGADPFVMRSGTTLLRHATSYGTPSQVDRLLRAGLDPNASSTYGDVALGAARDVDTARLLVAAGAKVDPVRAGWTPLMRAAQRGSLEVVEYLLSLGADPNIVASGGNNALAVAQKLRDKVASKAIAKKLSRVTKPDLPDERGRTALFLAAMRGDARTIDSLLARGAKADRKDRDGVTPVAIAALRADAAAAFGVAYAPLVPTHRADDPPAFVAVRRGEPLPTDADATLRNARGETLLHRAVALGDVAMIDALLARGADIHAVNLVGDSVWSLAIALHGMSLAEQVCARGGKRDLDRQVLTSSRIHDFRAALRAGDLRDVLRRVDANEVDLHLLQARESPLGLAVLAGDDEMVAMLLAAGADLHVRGWRGSLATEAAALGEVDVARRLLDAGTPLDDDAMQRAAEGGHVTMMRMLVERGVRLAVDVSDFDNVDLLMRVIDFSLEGGHADLAARASERLAAISAV